MPDSKQLIVHAGFPKTGSSALQYWLDTHTAELAEAGIFYPREGRSAEDALGHITSGNGKLLGKYLVPSHRNPGFDLDGFPDKFRKTFLRDDLKTLISREQIAAVDPKMLDRFKKEVIPDVELTFVIFIRNIYERERSWWLQKVKQRVIPLEFRDFVVRNSRSGADILRSIVDTIGRDNVKLLHYDSVSSDLLGAFLRAIGAESAVDAEQQRVRLVNRSLTDIETRVLMECSRVHGQQGIARLLSKHFMDKFPDISSTHTPYPEIISVLEKKHSSEIRWINDTFFDGEEMFSAGGRPKPKREAAVSSEMSEEQVWREVALVLAKELSDRLGPQQSKEEIWQGLRRAAQGG